MAFDKQFEDECEELDKKHLVECPPEEEDEEDDDPDPPPVGNGGH